MRKLIITALIGAVDSQPAKRKKKRPITAPFKKEVQTYLDGYNAEYQKLVTASSEGQWIMQTHIVEGDTIASHNAAVADEAYAQFTGSKTNIETAQKYLKEKDKLTAIQVKQLQYIYTSPVIIRKQPVML